MFSLADIIAQETQDGRLIIRFLISTMHGELPDSQPCHRLDAARLLVKLGFEPAQSLIDRAAPRRFPQPHPRSQPQAEPEPDNAEHRIRSALAEIVREEIDRGRTAVLFLVDAMQGQLPDFKPCHRLSAARELLRLGFNHDAEDQGQDDSDIHDLDEMDAFTVRYADYLHNIIDSTSSNPTSCPSNLFAAPAAPSRGAINPWNPGAPLAVVV